MNIQDFILENFKKTEVSIIDQITNLILKLDRLIILYKTIDYLRIKNLNVLL